MLHCAPLHLTSLHVPCLNRRGDLRFPSCNRCIQGLTVTEAIYFVEGRTITPINIKQEAPQRNWGIGKVSVCPECGAEVKERYNGYLIFNCEHGEARRKVIYLRKRDDNLNRKRRTPQYVKGSGKTGRTYGQPGPCPSCGKPDNGKRYNGIIDCGCPGQDSKIEAHRQKMRDKREKKQ